MHTLKGHDGSINAVAVLDHGHIASGAADGTVRIWSLTHQLLDTIAMKPRFFPLALSARRLPESETVMLAVAGTTNVVSVYIADMTNLKFNRVAVLTGHKDWVRSLSFTDGDHNNNILLASAGQEKCIRLWRIHRGGGNNAEMRGIDDDPMEVTLSNKTHEFHVAAGCKYSISFEALLLGSEDWIYTVSWNPNKQMQLLSASADNTLTIWEPDPVSGVWVSVERMGEMSAQKGSTSATGSAGGFWIGLWSPNGRQVVSLARTGSWRVWKYDDGLWTQALGISGHVRSVNDIQWDPTGTYLLSTSSDQTTRLHAEWLAQKSWREFCRPQIHGYDLNCIDVLSSSRFVSGADEKLLRVFDQPKPIAQLLETLSGFPQQAETEALPDTAEIPVLGLSNKPVGDEVPLEEEEEENKNKDAGQYNLLHLPPLEDHLARFTLWPEHEKLYGHGYEISALAVSHDHSIIATACKASSIDHAVIRLYDATDWHEIKPSLMGHSLTITRLCFSSDDAYLLSVGRDRQWTVFNKRDGSLFASNPKGHSRMILGASWAPQTTAFATAGRDKLVKIWQLVGGTFAFKSTLSLETAVTAISFSPFLATGSSFILATGQDNGNISIHRVAGDDSFEMTSIITFDPSISPSKTITQLRWRPCCKDKLELAVSSEDTSTRIYTVNAC